MDELRGPPPDARPDVDQSGLRGRRADAETPGRSGSRCRSIAGVPGLLAVHAETEQLAPPPTTPEQALAVQHRTPLTPSGFAEGAPGSHPPPALWRLARRTPRVTLAVALGVALLGVMWLTGRSAPRGTAPAPGNPLGEGRLLTPEVELRGVVRQLQEDTAVLRKSLDDVTRALQELREKKGPVGDAALSAKELERLEAGARAAAAAPDPRGGACARPAAAGSGPDGRADPGHPADHGLHRREARARRPGPAGALGAPPGRQLREGHAAVGGVRADPRRSSRSRSSSTSPRRRSGRTRRACRLRGCVAVARALGDYTTKRAGLQLDTMSCVLPSGRAVSQPVTGWVAGPDGVFGMPGELVEREGPYLARVSLAGFLHGASAAFAAAQTTTSIGALGNTTTTITGNEALYGALSGFANSGQPHGRLLRAAARVAGAGHLRAERTHGLRRHPGRRDARRRRDRAPARAHGRRPRGTGLD